MPERISNIPVGEIGDPREPVVRALAQYGVKIRPLTVADWRRDS